MTPSSTFRGLSDGSSEVAAFTRTELLVILAMLAMFAAMIRSVWGIDGSVESLVCMDNLRRLAAAWRLYADDNSGEFVGNYDGGFVPSVNARETPWVTGWLDWTTSSHNTNFLYLTQTRYANLAPYGGADATLYRCPFDRYLSAAQMARGWRTRVRSYSMNVCFGQGNEPGGGPLDPAYSKVIGWSSVGRQSPQQLFVFLEEHPDSINDGAFFPPYSQSWLDLPGSYHAGACWLTFADGHLEPRRWESPNTLRPVRFVSQNGFPASANDPDRKWVMDHSPQRKWQ
jgi:hypothetical protein